MQTLESIVQLQLATETTSVFYLPSVLENLTEELFQLSSHSSAGRTKWIARVNSLLHSKEPAGRWAGACLARRTAAVSKEILLECASGWITAALPWFSVRTTLFGGTQKTQQKTKKSIDMAAWLEKKRNRSSLACGYGAPCGGV